MIKKLIYIAIILFVPCLAWSQKGIHLKPLHQSTHARTSAEVRIDSLPFWDDFFKSEVYPDSSNWYFETSKNVLITPGTGVAPPTANAAVLDGWDFAHRVYNQNEDLNGLADELITHFIDLSAISSTDKSLYLSFFWQKEGLGEQPDPGDSIRLQALDTDSTWITLWSKDAGTVTRIDTFYYENIHITDSAFFHKHFRFRFQSFGKLSGGFDSWLLDYIYLDRNRTAERAIEDRAIASPTKSFLKRYTRVPLKYFNDHVDDLLQPLEVDFYNMDRLPQPAEYFCVVANELDGSVLQVLDWETPVEPVPRAFTRMTLVSGEPDPQYFFDLDSGSVLKTAFYINSGDTILPNGIDLRVNDTIYSRTILSNELAYDDGSAEFAIGGYGKRFEIALRFIIEGQDFLSGVKIHFPQFGSGSANKSFTINIYNEPTTTGLVYEQDHQVIPDTIPNQMNIYAFKRPVAVEDTFYIGISQHIEDFFPIGYDKNNTVHGNIFFKEGSDLIRDEKFNHSLMLRALFDDKPAVGIFDDPIPENNLKIYPNPTTGILYLEEAFDEAIVMDISGQTISSIKKISNTELDLSKLKAGIYLLRVLSSDEWKSVKFIKK